MPPLSFWFTGTSLYLFFSFAFVVGVALVGIRDMISGRLFIILIGAAIVLAFFAWRTAAIQERDAAEQKQRNDRLDAQNDSLSDGLGKIAAALNIQMTPKEIAAKPIDEVVAAITGGKNFCYFRLAVGMPPGPPGQFQLSMDATGSVFDVNYWISLESAKQNPQNPGYWSVDQRKPLIQIIYKGPRAWGRFLMPGDYIIEFDARNGHWVEHLSISVEDGKPKQNIRIIGEGGAVLYEDHDQ
ncbi:MAG TPA: hypothetical protein VMB81_12465 [Candidatus Sulfotelmatobacter sp.]|nr:hypothetical protein [Candidatus Sulfotelmatobacter sp.]